MDIGSFLYDFPDPEISNPNTIYALGGDLSPDCMFAAYAQGFFPWYRKDGSVLWEYPSPRMVLFPDEFHCSHSLRRVISSRRFEVRIDSDFESVIRSCGQIQRKNNGAWIYPEVIAAYSRLFDKGMAHSFETYLDGKLVGGLYGVSLGRFFAGESMFHSATDASKVAFAKLVEFSLLHDFQFIDAQQESAHLASLGARPIPKFEFEDLMSLQRTLISFENDARHWSTHTVVLLLGGNQGDRENLLSRAIELISKHIGFVYSKSLPYESAPWGFEAESNFLNLALVVETELPALQILDKIHLIENLLGRVRHHDGTYHSRTMDIDIIFYDSEIINQESLQVPHPRMHLRRFVLQPLRDIIPHFLHPKFHKTISQLLDECPDSGSVFKIFV